MKPTFNLVAVMVLATLIFLCSCSKTKDVSEPQEMVNQQEAFDQLIGNIDCLNKDFGISGTKGNGTRDGLKAAADIAGFIAGQSWGPTAFGWVGGVLTGSPMGAVAGYLCGQRYGGIVGSQFSSYIAGLGYDLFSGCQIIVPYPDSEENVACFELEADATIGKVHNFLLSRMEFKEEFVTVDNRLNIDAIYGEASENAQKYRIDDDLYQNEEFVAFIKECAVEIENIAYAIATNTAEKSSEQYIKEFLINKTNLSENELDNLLALSASLSCSSDMEDAVVEEYEQAFFDLVEQSKLNDYNKTNVKSVGSIAIRSNNYWYAGE